MQEGFPEQIEIPEVKRVVSRDEMNLAEFPLTVLSTRVNPSLKTLEFSDTVRSKNGEPIKRHWIVTGADKFGLPTASDDEVLLGLLKLTVQNGFRDPKIFFTRYELLKILRWTTEGRSYQRLQNAFDRLSGVRIKATNAFYDNEAKAHSTRNFGIVDAYEINHAGEAHGKPSFFIWSEVLFKSFQVGFIKKLDLDFYLALDSAVSKRLYRFLDKHFWYKTRLQINLFVLCHEKLGVSRNYRYASSLKQQIDPAIEELTKSGFLCGAQYQGRGDQTEVILIAAAKTPRSLVNSQNTSSSQLGPSGAPKIQASEQLSLTESVRFALCERGLRAAQANTLLEGKSENELKKVEKIIAYYDHLVEVESHLVSRSPVGFLYRAVENSMSFILPDQEGQTTLGFEKRESAKANTQAKNVDLLSAYLVFRKHELDRIKQEAEPEVVKRIRTEVESKLARMRGKISEAGFDSTVQHGVEDKLLKLFVVPEYEEWRMSRGLSSPTKQTAQ